MSTETTSSDTSAIDEKKNVNTSAQQVNMTTIKQYLQAIYPSVIKSVIYFILGGIVIYGFKIAQSSVLPTDINYYPYTKKMPNFEEVVSNIYETSTDPQYSQKVNFRYEDNNEGNTILDLTRTIKENKESSSVSIFFANIIQSLIRLNYSSLNEVFNSINEFDFNDFYIILFGPILLILFIFVFLMFVNPIYFIYLWFTNLGIFVKKDIHDDSSEHLGLDDPGYWFGVWIIFIFVILFFILFGFLGFFISLVSIFVVIFAILRYKCVLNEKPDIGLGTILTNNFLYYKTILAILISIPIITNANNILGPIPSALALIVVILMYTQVISIDIYESKELDKLSLSIPIRIARRLPDKTSMDKAMDKAKEMANKAKEAANKLKNKFSTGASSMFNNFKQAPTPSTSSAIAPSSAIAAPAAG